MAPILWIMSIVIFAFTALYNAECLNVRDLYWPESTSIDFHKWMKVFFKYFWTVLAIILLPTRIAGGLIHLVLENFTVMDSIVGSIVSGLISLAFISAIWGFFYWATEILLSLKKFYDARYNKLFILSLCLAILVWTIYYEVKPPAETTSFEETTSVETEVFEETITEGKSYELVIFAGIPLSNNLENENDIVVNLSEHDVVSYWYVNDNGVAMPGTAPIYKSKIIFMAEADIPRVEVIGEAYTFYLPLSFRYSAN